MVCIYIYILIIFVFAVVYLPTVTISIWCWGSMPSSKAWRCIVPLEFSRLSGFSQVSVPPITPPWSNTWVSQGWTRLNTERIQILRPFPWDFNQGNKWCQKFPDFVWCESEWLTFMFHSCQGGEPQSVGIQLPQESTGKQIQLSPKTKGCTNADRASVAPQQHQALEELQEPPRISPLWTCSKRRAWHCLFFHGKQSIRPSLLCLSKAGILSKEASLLGSLICPYSIFQELETLEISNNDFGLMILTRYIVNQDILLHECQAPPLEVVGPSASRESPSPMVHLAMLRKRHIPWHRSHSLADWHVRCVRPMEQRWSLEQMAWMQEQLRSRLLEDLVSLSRPREKSSKANSRNLTNSWSRVQPLAHHRRALNRNCACHALKID